MRIEFLGSGGAIPTPRPGCTCRVCLEAREKGTPYRRTGPSLFVPGPDIIFDTPEESKEQFNRANIGRVAACFYSHWHPDHVAGLRVWEALNQDFRRWPPQNRTTLIYLPQQVAQDFRHWMGYFECLTFFEKQGLVRVVELRDGDTVQVDTVRIVPFRLAEDYVYAFLVEADGRRVLLAPDELVGWDPPETVRRLDLAVLPMGVLEFDPFTAARRIPAVHPILKSEATYEQTLNIAAKLQAKRVVLTHIDEPDGLGVDDLRLLEERLKMSGRAVTFAYDTMVVDV
jgi:phosphoribosyl 1,2-cyclic phosphate phosphodiesterase